MSLEFDIVCKYLGIPYQHHGRTMSGLDCWGLIKFVYADLGIELIDIETYDEDWAKKGADYFIQNYHEKWEKVESPKMFDVALFRNKDGVACHAGVVIKEGMMLHSSKKTGVVLNNIKNGGFDRKLDGFYRIKVNNDNN